MDSGFDGPTVAFLAVIGVFLAIIVTAFVVAIIRGLIGWSRNNSSPLQTVPAVVVGKRGQVSGGSGDSSASTSYYVTFEIQGGERLELHLLGKQYGVLVDGDRGQLTYQGSRYKGFARTPQDR